MSTVTASTLTFLLRLLPLLLLTTPTASLLTTPSLTAHIPRTTAAALTTCESVCALMETQVRSGAPDDTLFRNLCLRSGRTDCEAIQDTFRIELVGKGDSFKCLCARNGAAGQQYESTTTTTSTATITMTEGDVLVEPSKAVESPAPVPSSSIDTTAVEEMTTQVAAESTTSTVLSTHTTLSTIRYAVLPTAENSTSAAKVKATVSSSAELNGGGEPVSRKPGGGAIAGIVIGVLAACAVIGGGAWIIRKRQLAKLADNRLDYDY